MKELFQLVCISPKLVFEHDVIDIATNHPPVLQPIQYKYGILLAFSHVTANTMKFKALVDAQLYTPTIDISPRTEFDYQELIYELTDTAIFDFPRRWHKYQLYIQQHQDHQLTVYESLLKEQYEYEVELYNKSIHPIAITTPDVIDNDAHSISGNVNALTENKEDQIDI